MKSQKKQDLFKTAKVLAAAKDLFDFNMAEFKEGRLKLYKLTIENKTKAFKKNFFKNLFTYCVIKEFIKIDEELIIEDMETNEPLAICTKNKIKF